MPGRKQVPTIALCPIWARLSGRSKTAVRAHPSGCVVVVAVSRPTPTPQARVARVVGGGLRGGCGWGRCATGALFVESAWDLTMVGRQAVGIAHECDGEHEDQKCHERQSAQRDDPDHAVASYAARAMRTVASPSAATSSASRNVRDAAL